MNSDEGEDIYNIVEDLIFDDIYDELLEEQHLVSHQVPRPCRTRPFSGEAMVLDMLHDAHPDRIYDMCRISRDVLMLLKGILVERGALKPTRFLGCNEQLCIFLFGIGHAIPNRVLAETFQHSGETISRHFNNVLNAILSLKNDYIQLPSGESNNIHPRIRDSTNFYPYFKRALGAIDGSHIPVIVARSKHNRYRNRKGFISQNVMAACSFDHTFLYVAAGWEGSAADMKVLRSVVETGKFTVPEGRYYLVDSGYANTPKFLAPYRGLRYHLGDYTNRETRAYRDEKDKFNHRHAQLRNAVEKAWGILKQRFKILKQATPYPYKTQVKIVIACCVLHNFIARHKGDDRYFNMLNADCMPVEEDQEVEDPQWMIGEDDTTRGAQLRNAIAQQLWTR